MRLYVGVDLHASNNFVAILDQEGKRIEQKRLVNDLLVIREFLEPYKRGVIGVVVESTYNWYWLVDGLMDLGYRVHLANPVGIQKYKGLKYVDDKHDAFINWCSTPYGDRRLFHIPGFSQEYWVILKGVYHHINIVTRTDTSVFPF